MIHIEHHPPVSSFLLQIERIQNFTMILYYPLEHTWWLAYHKIISISDERMNKIGVWGCRFWAAYVILQFLHLTIEWKLYKRRSRDVIKKVDGDEDDIRREKREIKKTGERIIRDTFINIGYLPLTVRKLRNYAFCFKFIDNFY
jgi:hypothetical protein